MLPVKVHFGFNAFDNSNTHCGCKTVPAAMRARKRGCKREIFFAAGARVPQIAIAPLSLLPHSWRSIYIWRPQILTDPPLVVTDTLTQHISYVMSLVCCLSLNVICAWPPSALRARTSAPHMSRVTFLPNVFWVHAAVWMDARARVCGFWALSAGLSTDSSWNRFYDGSPL